MRLGFASITILVFCMSATADQVTLKNGDRLTGKTVKADGKAHWRGLGGRSA